MPHPGTIPLGTTRVETHRIIRSKRTSGAGGVEPGRQVPVQAAHWDLMDLINTPTGSADPVAEVRRLRRELRRERALRRAAESVEARASARLFETVREMRSAQAELLD